MAFSLYETSGSFLHRTDPAAKMIVLSCWFVVAVLMTRPTSLVALALLTLGVAAAAGLVGALARFTRFMAILFAICALAWALFSGGGDAEAGPASGLLRGVWMGVRLSTMLAMGLVFLASTRVEEMAAALHRMGVPFKAAFSLTLAFRLLPLLAGSVATIVQAQASRGLDLREGGLMGRLRRYPPLLVPLVLSSLRTADGLAVALESRGLGMEPSRTSVLESRAGPGALLATALSVGAALAVAGLRLSGRVL